MAGSVRFDPRRLLKRPRSFRQWRRRDYVLVVSLVLAVVVLGWLMTVVRPTEFPPTKPPDQWAAEAAVVGGGALFFAVVATVIATFAYINSAEKPSLRVEASYDGRDEPLAVAWNNSQPDESGQITSVGERPSWWLTLRLYNDGPVAARFIAINVTFGAGAKLDTKGQTLLRQWQQPTERWLASSEFRWEGGADAVVHPSWPYRVPQLGPTYLILEGPQSQTSFEFNVEVVADDVPPFNKRCTICVPLGK